MKKYFRVFIIIFGLLFFISSNVYATNTEKSINDSAKTLLDIKEKQLSVEDDYKEKYGSEDKGKRAYTVHKLRMYIVPLTYIIGLICFVSLILNCVKKDIWKVIFNIIGILLSIIFYITISYKNTSFVHVETAVALVMCIVPIIVDIVIGILALMFCFKHNKELLKSEK